MEPCPLCKVNEQRVRVTGERGRTWMCDQCLVSKGEPFLHDARLLESKRSQLLLGIGALSCENCK